MVPKLSQYLAEGKTTAEWAVDFVLYLTKAFVPIMEGGTASRRRGTASGRTTRRASPTNRSSCSGGGKAKRT